MPKALQKINPRPATAAEKEVKAARAKLGIAAATAVQIDRVAQRFEKLSKKTVSWSAVDDDGTDPAKAAVTAIGEAAESLRHASDLLKSIPKEWTPVAKRGPGGRIEKGLKEGALVSIRDKAMSKYADAFTNGEGKSLTVERVGSLVVCRTRSGDRVFLKRGDLVLTPDAPTTAVTPA